MCMMRRRERRYEQLVLAQPVDREGVAVRELCSEMARPRARLDMPRAVHEQLAIAAVRELADDRHVCRTWTEAQLAERSLEVRAANEADFGVEILADREKLAARPVPIGVVVVPSLVCLLYTSDAADER